MSSQQEVEDKGVGLLFLFPVTDTMALFNTAKSLDTQQRLSPGVQNFVVQLCQTEQTKQRDIMSYEK